MKHLKCQNCGSSNIHYPQIIGVEYGSPYCLDCWEDYVDDPEERATSEN